MNASAQVRVLKRAVSGLEDARHAVCELDQNRDLLDLLNESLRIAEECLEQQIGEAEIQEPGWQEVCFPSRLVTRARPVFRADAPSPSRTIDLAEEIV